MRLAHAITIAEARSYIAALADTARTVEGSIAYERVLLQLDLVHSDQAPANEELPHTLAADLLYRLAVKAIQDLVRHGVDALHVEFVLAALLDARDTDSRMNGHLGRP